MITALHEVREKSLEHKKIKDMRTAAYVCAIDKVGVAYEQLGIFP
jgi:glutamate dehydrogenase (NAD(P)+)